jgi:hypothetical protein
MWEVFTSKYCTYRDSLVGDYYYYYYYFVLYISYVLRE